MKPSVLIVDDEHEILNSLERVLRKHYTVHAYTDPHLALCFFAESPCQIVISDMKMPTMNGADFLEKIYKINPRCKRIILTGYADLSLTQKAINDAKISSYLNKPWNNKELLELVETLIEDLKVENKKLLLIKKLKSEQQMLTLYNESMSVTADFMEDEHKNILHHRDSLITSHKELLNLSASLIAMQTGDNTGHSFRIAKQAKALAKQLKLSKQDCFHIYLSGLYHRVGITTLDKKLTTTPWHLLSQQEQYQWSKYPQASAEILSATTFLQPCEKMLMHLNENIDGSGIPQRLKKQDIPIGSRILAIVIYFDLLISGEVTGQCLAPAEANVLLNKLTHSLFDQTFVTAFQEELSKGKVERACTVEDLEPGMILANDIKDGQKHKLLLEGTKLTTRHIDSLIDYQTRVNSLVIAYVIQP